MIDLFVVVILIAVAVIAVSTESCKITTTTNRSLQEAGLQSFQSIKNQLPIKRDAWPETICIVVSVGTYTDHGGWWCVVAVAVVGEFLLLRALLSTTPYCTAGTNVPVR